MKTLLKHSLYYGISFFFILSCAKVKGIADDVEVNDFVWKGLNAYYLHQDEVADLSDRKFSSDQQLNSYLRGFSDPNTLFSSLLLTGDTKSVLVDDFTTLDNIPLRTSATNGMEFGIIAEPNDPDKVLGYVSYILPNSDASTKNIARGEFFYAVDGTQLTRTNYGNLLLTGNPTITLAMADFNGTTVTPNAKMVNLVKNSYTHPSIFLEKTITVGATNIGYLLYNNDFSTNYIADINNSFLNFKNQNVTELILDFRYNIGTGSYVKTISQLAEMITQQPTTEIFLKEKWNTKAQPWFEMHQPDSLLTKFMTTLNDVNTSINSVNITDVYIILNGVNFAGSSSLELLINSLKPYINVHVIGNQTAGNNTGSITLYNSVDFDSIGKSKNHTYALQPIVLSFYNKDDQTYENGITPEIQLCPNEDILDLGVLGETTDPILDRILTLITTGNSGVNPPCNPNDFEFIYNSTNAQRPTDRGVFIKQDLPNTL